MSALLLDTHVWAWSLQGSERLSDPARDALVGAKAVYVSPISFFEIGQKVRLGKWRAMEPLATRLAELLAEQGGLVAGLTPRACLAAGTMNWTHRDPFDRLIAATALEGRLALVSADSIFDQLEGSEGWPGRVW